MFNNIKSVTTDPIFGITELFNSDIRPNKINLSIGIYKDSVYNSNILQSVKKAEHFMHTNENTKDYLCTYGLKKFNKHVQNMLFNKWNSDIDHNRIKTLQTVGGTGALYIIANFLFFNFGRRKVWISDPSWDNHEKIFKSLGHTIKKYKYYNTNDKTSVDFNGMINSLEKTSPGDIILLHGCCHNPTGLDLNLDQWNVLSELTENSGLVPIFDFAYHGFDISISDDVLPLKIFCKNHDEILISTSFSKNFCLYSERVGAVTILAANASDANAIFSQMNNLVRITWSNPPMHGASIVASILESNELRSIWLKELNIMRMYILKMRNLFYKKISKKIINYDFNYIKKQKGIFTILDLTKKQVSLLREKFGIYMLESGRINISGLNINNIHVLCDAIYDVFDK